MLKKRNEKGFTLAELLVVVAIIAILVAIAIPVFTSQTIKAKETADIANLRSIYAEASVAMISDNTEFPKTKTDFLKYDRDEALELNYDNKFTIEEKKETQKDNNNNDVEVITSYTLTYDAKKTTDWTQMVDVTG